MRSGTSGDRCVRQQTPLRRRSGARRARGTLPAAGSPLGVDGVDPRIEPGVHRGLRGRPGDAVHSIGIRRRLRCGAVGRERLPAGARRFPADRRRRRRPLRFATGVHRRQRDFCPRRARGRPGAQPRLAGVIPCHSGAGRRRAGAGEPGPDQPPLRQGVPRQGHRHLGRGIRPHHRGRSGLGRLAGGCLRLAERVPDGAADRAGHRRPGPVAGSRGPPRIGHQAGLSRRAAAGLGARPVDPGAAAGARQRSLAVAVDIAAPWRHLPAAPAAHARPHAAPRAVPQPQLHRRQSGDSAPLLGPERNAVLPAVQPDSDTRLLGPRGRPGAAADDPAAGRRLRIRRRPDPPMAAQTGAHGRTRHRRGRLRHAGSARHRRPLPDRLAPGHRGHEHRHDHQRGAAHHGGDERGGRPSGRRRLGHQQQRRPARRRAGHRRPDRAGGTAVRRRARSPSRRGRRTRRASPGARAASPSSGGSRPPRHDRHATRRNPRCGRSELRLDLSRHRAGLCRRGGPGRDARLALPGARRGLRGEAPSARSGQPRRLEAASGLGCRLTGSRTGRFPPTSARRPPAACPSAASRT